VKVYDFAHNYIVFDSGHRDFELSGLGEPLGKSPGFQNGNLGDSDSPIDYQLIFLVLRDHGLSLVAAE